MQIILPVVSLSVLSIAELRALCYAAAEYRDAEAIHLAAGADKTLRLANRLWRKSEVVILCPSPDCEPCCPGGLLDGLRKAVQKMFVKGIWKPENWDTWKDPLWLGLGYIHEQLPEGGEHVQVHHVRRDEGLSHALRRQGGGRVRADRAQDGGEQNP